MQVPPAERYMFGAHGRNTEFKTGVYDLLEATLSGLIGQNSAAVLSEQVTAQCEVRQQGPPCNHFAGNLVIIFPYLMLFATSAVN